MRNTKKPNKPRAADESKSQDIAKKWVAADGERYLAYVIGEDVLERLFVGVLSSFSANVVHFDTSSHSE
jgi:hypothetical protein